MCEVDIHISLPCKVAYVTRDCVGAENAISDYVSTSGPSCRTGSQLSHSERAIPNRVPELTNPEILLKRGL